MNVSNLRSASSSSFQMDSTSFRRGGVEQGGLKNLFGKGGLKDLIKGTQELLKSLQAVEKLMQGMKAGGMQKAGAASPSKACSPSPFEQSSFSPSSSKAPVELNPSASGPSGMAGPSSAGAPNSAGGPSSAGSAGAPSAMGDAKAGPGFPSALGQFKGAIESAAAKTGVPAAMLTAQIWQESRGNISAVTTNGGNGLSDTGLMQVNPNTFKELQSKYPELQGKNLSDPETNILAGAYYMKDMKEQFGSWDLALRAYNSGPNGVDKSNPNAIPAGTGDATYVQKVKAFAETIASGKGTLPA